MNINLRKLFFLVTGVFVFCEIPASNWHSYLSYYQTIAVVKGDQKIYAATENGLFSYQPADQSFETKSRVDGLSDSGITSIAWSTSKEALLIGYSNGNLDLLSENSILNLPDLKLKTSIADKSINNIFCEGDFAWLSCNFGIVKINLKRWEVAETWVIGTDASPIKVKELTTDGRYFWAATESGVFRADKANPNLQDYHNWILQDQLPFPQGQYHSIAVSGGKVYTCDSAGKTYAFDGNIWQPVYTDIEGVQKIKAFESGLAFVCDKKIEVISANGRMSVSTYGSLIPSTSIISPSDVLLINSAELWISDHIFGLIYRTTSGQFIQTVPSSPANNNSKWLTTIGNNLFAATGDDKDESAITPAEIHRLENQNWFSVNQFTDINLSGLKNITRVVPSPSNQVHYWASTRGDGLIEFNGRKLVKKYNSSNSPLESENGTCKIGGLTYDSKGNLWMTNPVGRNQLHLIKQDGTWKSFSYPGIDNPFYATDDVVITRTDTKFVIVNHSEIFALQSNNTLENTDDDKYRKISVKSKFSNDETTVIKGFNQINILKEDLDGYLWVGTENGVVVYTNPDLLLGNTEVYGIQPSVDLGDGIFHPLLGNEIVNTIAVDGGNRKWFGTTNSGVYLFSADGSKLIRHFNTDNSPLFSNNITSIAINGMNGEVFFATGRGLISWIGDATESKNSYEQLYVWPNPVRETYHGDITIDGLTNESNVKITDVTGNLVYQTTSIGGRAIWDGKNRNGERVNTGVYLIFCAGNRGSQSRVIKLLFIH
jgi:hypothetical protein